MKKITAQFYWMLQKGVIEDQNQSIVFDNQGNGDFARGVSVEWEWEDEILITVDSQDETQPLKGRDFSCFFTVFLGLHCIPATAR